MVHLWGYGPSFQRWAFWGPAEVRTPTQIDTTDLRTQGHRGHYTSFVLACTRRFHCAVDFATVGSLSKGNEQASPNRLRSQAGIQALFGSMSRCLKHAVGRSLQPRPDRAPRGRNAPSHAITNPHSGQTHILAQAMRPSSSLSHLRLFPPLGLAPKSLV